MFLILTILWAFSTNYAIGELLTKEEEEKKMAFDPGHLFFGERELKGLYHADFVVFFLGGIESAHGDRIPENSRLVD